MLGPAGTWFSRAGWYPRGASQGEEVMRGGTCEGGTERRRERWFGTMEIYFFKKIIFPSFSYQFLYYLISSVNFMFPCSVEKRRESNKVNIFTDLWQEVTIY